LQSPLKLSLFGKAFVSKCVISGSRRVRQNQATNGTPGWNVCVLYASGQEKILWSCRTRELALRSIDALYGYGYPLHFAYVVRQTLRAPNTSQEFASHPLAQHLKLKMLAPHQAPAWYS
jgi:hypothetical protein